MKQKPKVGKTVQMILDRHGREDLITTAEGPRIAGVKGFEELSVRKILAQIARSG